MNRLEKQFTVKGEAKLKYLSGDFQVLEPGNFVRCAVSGAHIPLDRLRYWSVDLQEAYDSAEISIDRYRGRCKAQVSPT